VGDYKTFIMRWQLCLLGLKQRFELFSIFFFFPITYIYSSFYYYIEVLMKRQSSPVKKEVELGLEYVKFYWLDYSVWCGFSQLISLPCAYYYHNFTVLQVFFLKVL